MTKCIVLGEEPTEVKKKPIEFVKAISGEIILKGFETPCNNPSGYDFIELISKSFDTDLYYDVIFAYNGRSRDTGCTFLGYWNDGVV